MKQLHHLPSVASYIDPATAEVYPAYAGVPHFNEQEVTPLLEMSQDWFKALKGDDLETVNLLLQVIDRHMLALNPPEAFSSNGN